MSLSLSLSLGTYHASERALHKQSPSLQRPEAEWDSTREKREWLQARGTLEAEVDSLRRQHKDGLGLLSWTSGLRSGLCVAAAVNPRSASRVAAFSKVASSLAGREGSGNRRMFRKSKAMAQSACDIDTVARGLIRRRDSGILINIFERASAASFMAPGPAADL